jgi:hypothetical protein
MSNKKTEFVSKGTPSELIFDNGNSYLSKDVFRGDYKGPEERMGVRKKMDKDNHAPSDRPKKEG